MTRLGLLLVFLPLTLACEPSSEGSSEREAASTNGKTDEAPPIECEGNAYVCVTPGQLACEGDEGNTFDCTESGRVCGWDFDARHMSCVTAAEQCDRPGEDFCLTSIDTARCTDAGLVEPGQPCMLTGQACGWDPDAYNPATESYGRMGCVDAPPICGRLDEPCCGAPGTCGRGLVCFEGICRESSPGCGTEDEPCCNGSICHEGFECGDDALCDISNGNCGREGEGCCGATVCAQGLSCAGGACTAE